MYQLHPSPTFSATRLFCTSVPVSGPFRGTRNKIAHFMPYRRHLLPPRCWRSKAGITHPLGYKRESVGAGAVLTHATRKTEGFITFTSRCFLNSGCRRGPIKREYMATHWAVAHFRPYLAGRRFTLGTDYPALTWLFRSLDKNPKLHRRALRLVEHDVVLQWRARSTHQLPGVLSRSPHTPTTQVDIDDSPRKDP